MSRNGLVAPVRRASCLDANSSVKRKGEPSELEHGPTIVPRILAELEASDGSVGRDVKSWYDQAKAELDTVPATKS